jgi:hypothetical protein
MPVAPEVPNYRQSQVQPMPLYSAPSAFDRDDTRMTSIPLYMSPPAPLAQFSMESGIYPSGSLPPIGPPVNSLHFASSPALDRVIENIQGHIASLSERIDKLENDSRRNLSLQPLTSNNDPSRVRILPIDPRRWDASKIGLWSIIFRPLSRVMSRVMSTMSSVVEFLLGPTYAHGPAHPGLTFPSPVLVIIRRLTLDATFIFMGFAITRYIYRRNGIRRRAIEVAFRNLFLAMIGRDVSNVGEIKS